MRVLLVQPPLAPSGPVEPPVGLAALAAWLQQRGDEPRILDLDLFQRRAGRADWSMCTAELKRVLDEFEPRVVGVTSMYSNSLLAARLVAAAKAARPDVVTLAGGSHFGALPRESLLRIPELDFVIQGEAEGPLSAFLDALERGHEVSGVPSLAWREAGRIRVNPAGDLIDLARLPNAWTLPVAVLDPALYLATSAAPEGRRVAYVEAGRGCPFRCSFCATAPFWRRRYRVKPVERIVDEIRALHAIGYDRFILVHDLLTVNRRFVGDLCDALLESRLPVEWMANSRTDISLQGLLPRMKAAGCWKLFFGIESASARLQAAMDKHLDPETAFDTVAEMAAHGLTSTCSFVLGFPDETREEASRSIQAGARMKLVGAELVQFHRLRIWPPAPLSETTLPRTFDPSALAIEYPYLEVPKADLEAIAADPGFFGGYFTIPTGAGDADEIAQLEMFAHHAVALAPMTVYVLAALRPGRLVAALYEVLGRRGPIAREALDWDAGQLLQNWRVIRPVLAELGGALELCEWEQRLVQGALAYEDERARFTTGGHPDKPATDLTFRSSVDIPAMIEAIRRSGTIAPDLMTDTDITFVRHADGNYGCYAGRAPATV